MMRLPLLGCLGFALAQAPTGKQVLCLGRFQQRFDTGEQLDHIHTGGVFSSHDHHRFTLLQAGKLNRGRAELARVLKRQKVAI